LYKLSKDIQLTHAHIIKYIENDVVNKVREEKLYRMYQGKNDILQRTLPDPSKPNNKVPHNYSAYITDNYVGYFLGTPVMYNSENKDYMETLQQVFDFNDESSHNVEIGQDASVFGVAYELIYIDDDKNICFLSFDSREIIPIYANTLTNELLFAIRYYNEEDIISGNVITKVEVYTDSEFIYYDKSESGLVETDRKQHIFKTCPVIEYRNNKEMQGDFESSVPLIEHYDWLVSESANDFSLFADAYMKLINMDGTDKETLQDMKENRVILVPENGDAEWMVKTTPFEHIKEQKDRCVNEIHKLSRCPDLTDENFASNASGVAMKYKLFGFELKTVKKEHAFEKALKRRIKLITYYMLHVWGFNFDANEIDITFTRNLPVNESDEADAILKWQGVVSKETILEKCPLVKDVQKELDRIDNEVSLTPYTFQTPPDNTGGEVDE
jgi:SPP1 family phage portal protein